MKTIKHLYIHVPFCNTICNYCDFAHRIYQDDTVNKWLATIKKEIIDKCRDQYETIYIGGGTPTSLNDEQLEHLLKILKPYTNKVIEYTIEINPDSLTLNKVKLFVEYGINRVSMGVQSSDDAILKALNRKHTFGDCKNAIKLLKDNGINNISVDLMYSLPNQTIEILNKTIDDILSLDVPHISLYSLTIEKNSVFGKKGVKPLDIDIEADMYELIERRLKENDYIQYEVSNFAKEGYESKHNLGYWNYEDFLGISLSSSSKIGNHRYTSTKNFESYFNDYNTLDEDLYLNNEDLMFENIMMSLRTIYGLNINDFNDKYNCDLLSKYKKALSNNNVYIDNGFLKVKNFAILNNTLLDFMD